MFSLVWAVCFVAANPGSWGPTTRLVFSRQLLFTAVDGLFVSMRIAFAVGVLTIVQASMWIDSVGASTEDIVPTLWRAVIREIAPLIACLVVIGRSCIAISTELANMLVNGEIEVLETQGIDPMTTQVMPRVLSVTISVFCLSIVVAASMMCAGFAVGAFADVIRIPWPMFVETVMRQMSWQDMLFFLPKTFISGAFIGAICCHDGLSVRGTLADVPRVTSRSGINAMSAVFGVSAILSLMIYGRFLVFKVF